MWFTIALSALSLVSSISAQMVIQVGAEASSPGGIFQFIPPTITASNGTVLTFQFMGAPGNHSVTQSTFTDPCDPVDGGFDSGWVFIPDATTIANGAPEFNLTITNDQQPIWFFCKQLLPMPHCSMGMVGAINPPTTGNNTFDAFRTAAMNFGMPSGQGQNGLAGIGASASAGVGPLPSGVSLFPATAGSSTGSAAAPGGSATSPAGSGTSAAGSATSPTGSVSANTPAPTTSTAAATSLIAPSLFALGASLLGFIIV